MSTHEDFTADPIDSARLAAIVDSSYDAIISKDLNSVITSWNAAAQRMFGYSAEEAVGRSILMLIPEPLQSEEADIIARIKLGERVETYETTRLRKDGTFIEVSLTISPIRSPDGTIVGASKIARDISETREAERRIRVLLREVNHRVKNQFAVILSIIRESSNRARSPAEFEEQVRARIMALSRSHDLLVNSDWSGASLFDLVQGHLTIFGHDDRVSMSGPMVTLQPNAVQNLGMAIHELGTNAAKYGALTDGEGHISVSWEISDEPDEGRTFRLLWDETSSAQAASPTGTRRGFGSIVLERVVPIALSGTAELVREPGKCRWSLRAPLNHLVSTGGEERSSITDLHFNPL